MMTKSIDVDISNFLLIATLFAIISICASFISVLLQINLGFCYITRVDSEKK